MGYALVKQLSGFDWLIFLGFTFGLTLDELEFEKEKRRFYSVLVEERFPK